MTGHLLHCREQEAALCLAIPTGFYLASCITPGPESTVASEDGGQKEPSVRAYTAVSVILLRCHRHNLVPCALRLGGGTLLTRICQISWVRGFVSLYCSNALPWEFSQPDVAANALPWGCADKAWHC